MPRNWSGKLNGSDERLRAVFCRKRHDEYVLSDKFRLPRRDNHDYAKRLQALLEDYSKAIKVAREVLKQDFTTVRRLVDMQSRDIPLVLEAYHAGFPSDAYLKFEETMNDLVKGLRNHLGGGRAAGYLTVNQEGSPASERSLFRMRPISDSREYAPRDVFHAPATSRQVISSSRYSIAGYPSLYLTNSLELARHETGMPAHAIASRFHMVEKLGVLDLGIRPDDFDFVCTSDTRVEDAFIISYLCWYPVLAACSFVRADTEQQGYHDEYVIPQLLMQWLRKIGQPPHSPREKLDGLSNPPTSTRKPTENDSEKGSKAYADQLAIDATDLLFSLKTPLAGDTTEVADTALDRAAKKLRDAEAIHRNNGDSEGIAFDISAMISLLLQRVHPRLFITSNLSNLERLLNQISLKTYRLAQVLHSLDGQANPRESPLYQSEVQISEQLQSVYSKDYDIRRGSFTQELDGTLAGTLRLCFIAIEDVFELLISDDHLGTNKRKSYRRFSRIISNCRDNLKWAREGGPDIVGIRYFSCRDFHSVEIGRNYVFPTEFESGEIDGFSVSLAGMFEWTLPRHLEDYASPEDCERTLCNDPLLDGKSALEETRLRTCVPNPKRTRTSCKRNK